MPGRSEDGTEGKRQIKTHFGTVRTSRRLFVRVNAPLSRIPTQAHVGLLPSAGKGSLVMQPSELLLNLGAAWLCRAMLYVYEFDVPRLHLSGLASLVMGICTALHHDKLVFS